MFCALEAAKPIYINSHLYQTEPPAYHSAQLNCIDFLLACLIDIFLHEFSSGEKITKSSKKLTFRMIVRASVGECSVRFASLLQINRWEIRHPTDGVLARGTLLLAERGRLYTKSVGLKWA